MESKKFLLSNDFRHGRIYAWIWASNVDEVKALFPEGKVYDSVSLPSDLPYLGPGVPRLNVRDAGVLEKSTATLRSQGSDSPKYNGPIEWQHEQFWTPRLQSFKQEIDGQYWVSEKSFILPPLDLTVAETRFEVVQGCPPTLNQIQLLLDVLDGKDYVWRAIFKRLQSVVNEQMEFKMYSRDLQDSEWFTGCRCLSVMPDLSIQASLSVVDDREAEIEVLVPRDWYF